MKRLVDILPKIVEWRAIPYANDLMCQDCGKSGFLCPTGRYPNLVGWCETNYGYQAVFECTECGSKFRFHGGDPVDELDEFDTALYFTFADKCENFEELREKLGLEKE